MNAAYNAAMVLHSTITAHPAARSRRAPSDAVAGRQLMGPAGLSQSAADP